MSQGLHLILEISAYSIKELPFKLETASWSLYMYTNYQHTCIFYMCDGCISLCHAQMQLCWSITQYHNNRASAQWLVYVRTNNVGKNWWDGSPLQYKITLNGNLYGIYVYVPCMHVHECFWCDMEIAHLPHQIRRFHLVSKNVRTREKQNGKILVVLCTSTYPLNG